MTTPSTKPPLKPTIATHPTATEYVRAYRHWCYHSEPMQDAGAYETRGLCAYIDEREESLHPIARANQPAAANDPVTGDCSLHSKPEPCIYCLADSANDAEDCADCVMLSTGCLRARKAEAELSTLRTKYDLMVATMAKDGEEADPRDAVVEAARVTMAKLENYFDEYGGEHLGDCPGDDTCECPLLVELNAALRAQQEAVTVLDRPSQPEPAGEREIMVGSTWRRRPGRSHAGVEHKVTGRSANGWVKTEAVDRYEPSIWNPTRWHEQLEWVSDPPAVTESATENKP